MLLLLLHDVHTPDLLPRSGEGTTTTSATQTVLWPSCGLLQVATKSNLVRGDRMRPLHLVFSFCIWLFCLYSLSSPDLPVIYGVPV